MALDIQSLIDTGTVAARVQAITGDAQASATAAGYAAWVAAATGSAPTVARIGSENRVRMVMTERQQIALRQWLDGQVGGLFSPQAAPPVVDSGMGEVLTPWALQYAGPAIIGALVLGWVAHWLIQGRK